ncbi:MAG: SEL1-like repeat protein [Saprospiraceae bacterium]|nr:SEL1-like repeat protein [Saprospiraceae bacterium]
MGRYLKAITMEIEKEMVAIFKEDGINSIFSMYEFLLEKMDTQGIEKVIVSFTQDNLKDYAFEEKLNVITVYRFLDLNGYLKLGVFDRKKMILDKIQGALIFLSSKLNWNTESIKTVYKTVLDKNIKFEQFWKKSKWNSDKSLMAKVFWEFDQEIRVYFIIENSDKNEVGKFLVSKLPPGIGALEDALGDLIWIDKNKLRLFQSNKKDFWQLDINQGRIEYFFDRAIKGDSHGQYDLGLKYLKGNGILPDREKGIYWLKKAAENNYKRAVDMLKTLK